MGTIPMRHQIVPVPTVAGRLRQDSCRDALLGLRTHLAVASTLVVACGTSSTSTRPERSAQSADVESRSTPPSAEAPLDASLTPAPAKHGRRPDGTEIGVSGGLVGDDKVFGTLVTKDEVDKMRRLPRPRVPQPPPTRASRRPKSVVTLGIPNITGSLATTAIQHLVRQHHASLRTCFESEAWIRPNIQGTVIVKLHIAPTGKVLSSSAVGVDGKVARCMARVIREIRFPEDRDGGLTMVRYLIHVRMR